MKRYRVEIVLAAVLAALVAWFWHSQSPGNPLSRAETDRYLTTIEQKFPFPTSEMKSQALARMRVFAEHDDGRDFYMLNLLRFNQRMASGPAPAARFVGTPAQANAVYEDNAMPVALGYGAFPIMAGMVSEPNVIGGADPAEDNWSRVIVMHYPSRRHFFDLLTDPTYLSQADLKSYAMHIALVPVKRELVIPDLKTAFAAVAVILFLLVALVRALRAKAPKGDAS